MWMRMAETGDNCRGPSVCGSLLLPVPETRDTSVKMKARQEVKKNVEELEDGNIGQQFPSADPVHGVSALSKCKHGTG